MTIPAAAHEHITVSAALMRVALKDGPKTAPELAQHFGLQKNARILMCLFDMRYRTMEVERTDENPPRYRLTA